MVVEIEGLKYYRTNDACKIAGISRATFFRWLREGQIKDVTNRDRRGWRLFTDEDIKKLKEEANKIVTIPTKSEDDS